MRAKPLPNCTARETAGSLYFTPELVPAASFIRWSSHVAKRLCTSCSSSTCSAISSSTDILENEVVTPVAYMIARRQVGLAIPATMLVDARRIVVDETHHALMAASLIQDIAATSGVPALPAGRPSFLVELEEIKAAHDRDLAPLLMLFFAIVSETLITRTLTRIPDDERVVTARSGRS